MIIFNTTYSMPASDARAFVIWMTQSVFARAEQSGYVSQCRILRVLSHREADEECFAVEMHAADTAALHRWLVGPGRELSAEMQRLFADRLACFGSIMDTI